MLPGATDGSGVERPAAAPVLCRLRAGFLLVGGAALAYWPSAGTAAASASTGNPQRPDRRERRSPAPAPCP